MYLWIISCGQSENIFKVSTFIESAIASRQSTGDWDAENKSMIGFADTVATIEGYSSQVVLILNGLEISLSPSLHCN